MAKAAKSSSSEEYEAFLATMKNSLRNVRSRSLKSNDGNSDTESGEISPTRVSEFDSPMRYPGENLANGGSSSQQRQEDEASKNTSSSRKLLTTLDEVSISSQGEQSTDSRHDEDEVAALSPRKSQEESENRDAVRRNSPVPEIAVPSVSVALPEAPMVKKLKGIASNLALRGKEQDSLENYRVALKMTRADLLKVKRKLEGDLEPDARLKFHNEWIMLASYTAEIHTNMAILEERTGDYKKALKSCREARAIYHKLAKFEERFSAFTEQMNQMVAQLKRAGETFDERRRLHQKAIHLRRRIKVCDMAKEKQKYYREVFECLDAVLRMEREALGDAHPQVADTIGLVGTIHVEIKKMDKAIGYFNKALSILRLALGPYHPKSAMGFKQLAALYETRNKPPSDMDRALKLYLEAARAFKESYGNNHSQVGSTLNNVALLYIQRKEYDRAVEALSDALAAYESAAEDNDGFHPDTAQIWKNLGQVYYFQGQWDSAIMAYSSSLDVQRTNKQRQQNAKPAVEWQVAFLTDQSLADTLQKLGKAMLEARKATDALDTYEEALVIHKEAVKIMTKHHAETKDNNGMLVAQEHVASTMQLIAGAQAEMGKLEEAMEVYVQTLMMLRQNSALRGDDSQNNEGCAASLAGIGVVHLKRGEMKDAQDVLKDALSCYEKCPTLKDPRMVEKVKENLEQAKNGKDSPLPPDSGRKKKDRTIALEEEAQDRVDSFDFEGGIRLLTQVLVIRRQRLTKAQRKSNKTTDMKEKDDIARTLSHFAEVLVKQSDYEQAIVLYEEAARMYRSNGISPKDEKIKCVLLSLDELYQLADR